MKANTETRAAPLAVIGVDIGKEIPAQLALCNIGEPQGRNLAANGQADPRSLRGLVPSGRAHRGRH